MMIHEMMKTIDTVKVIKTKKIKIMSMANSELRKIYSEIQFPGQCFRPCMKEFIDRAT